MRLECTSSLQDRNAIVEVKGGKRGSRYRPFFKILSNCYLCIDVLYCMHIHTLCTWLLCVFLYTCYIYIFV